MLDDLNDLEHDLEELFNLIFEGKSADEIFATELGGLLLAREALFEGIYAVNPDNLRKFIGVSAFFEKLSETYNGRLRLLDNKPQSLSAGFIFEFPSIKLADDSLSGFIETLRSTSVFGINPSPDSDEIELAFGMADTENKEKTLELIEQIAKDNCGDVSVGQTAGGSGFEVTVTLPLLDLYRDTLKLFIKFLEQASYFSVKAKHTMDVSVNGVWEAHSGV